LLADLQVAAARIEGATTQAPCHCERLCGADPLLTSLPGDGPGHRPMVRALLGDDNRVRRREGGRGLRRNHPSTWSSGAARQPGRAITEEGRTALRLALYLAAKAGRRSDPQLAAFHHRLMTERRALSQPGQRRSRPQARRAYVTGLHRGERHELLDQAAEDRPTRREGPDRPTFSLQADIESRRSSDSNAHAFPEVTGRSGGHGRRSGERANVTVTGSSPMS
jgi:hypothetical protein